MFKRLLNLLTFSAIVFALLLIYPHDKVYAATPVNSNASPQARNVLNYIAGLSGNSIISGQHDKPGYPTSTYNRAKEITGQYPGIWGSDFGFSASGNDTIYNRVEIVEIAKDMWSKNVIPTLTWHMTRPDYYEPSSWSGGVIDCPLSSQQWIEITTPGTSMYNCFISRIDSVVWAFQNLRDAGVPVLWRPFHEMNGNWFWWGGNATYSKKLYQIMYDRYVNYWGLNNLIWVWNVDRPSNGAPSSYYPGHNYVDILSMDIYDNDFNYSYYSTMVSLANGKPIALGEVGDLPTPSITAAQPKWTYFMGWTEHLTGNNTNSEIQTLYWDYRTITRDEIPNLSSNSVNYALNKPAYASSVESSSYPASNAFDGNSNTRWASEWSDSHWIYVDLGEVRGINKVIISWEAAYARQYQIQVSTDGWNWTTVYTNSNGMGGTEYCNFSWVNARYVKMYAWQRATSYGYSIYEMGVY